MSYTDDLFYITGEIDTAMRHYLEYYKSNPEMMRHDKIVNYVMWHMMQNIFQGAEHPKFVKRLIMIHKKPMHEYAIQDIPIYQ